MVVTGCTAIPQPNNKYCQEHEGTESPIITTDKLSEKTKKILRDRRKIDANYKEVGQDDMYVIESIEDIKKDKSFNLK